MYSAYGFFDPVTEFLFSGFQWYRKYLGGTWYLVAPWPALLEINPFWSRYVGEGEKIIKIEMEM